MKNKKMVFRCNYSLYYTSQIFSSLLVGFDIHRSGLISALPILPSKLLSSHLRKYQIVFVY